MKKWKKGKNMCMKKDVINNNNGGKDRRIEGRAWVADKGRNERKKKTRSESKALGLAQNKRKREREMKWIIERERVWERETEQREREARKSLGPFIYLRAHIGQTYIDPHTHIHSDTYRSRLYFIARRADAVEPWIIACIFCLWSLFVYWSVCLALNAQLCLSHLVPKSVRFNRWR